MFTQSALIKNFRYQHSRPLGIDVHTAYFSTVFKTLISKQVEKL